MLSATYHSQIQCVQEALKVHPLIRRPIEGLSKEFVFRGDAELLCLFRFARVKFPKGLSTLLVIGTLLLLLGLPQDMINAIDAILLLFQLLRASVQTTHGECADELWLPRLVARVRLEPNHECLVSHLHDAFLDQ